MIAWINEAGEAVFNKVTTLVGDFGQVVIGKLIFKKDAKTAGVAGFEPGKSEVFIKSYKVGPDSLIYITHNYKPR